MSSFSMDLSDMQKTLETPLILFTCEPIEKYLSTVNLIKSVLLNGMAQNSPWDAFYMDHI